MLTLTEKSFSQPTLAVYLGGSGILVGEHLLAMREELRRADRGLIETFFIDSQEPLIVDHERARHYCYKDLGVFFEPIYREFTEQRFPENLGADRVVSSCQGCGVTRIFGAASLVACRDDFGALIEQGAARLRKQRAESTQPLQVFLTASACGGTGAGMILDAAAMVRHVFRSRVGESPRISLFLLGPSAFFEDPAIKLREDQRDRMRASAYALLKELHHFAQGQPFISAYRLRDEVIQIGNASDEDRLFDWVYFVDGRSERGGAARSLAEVAWTVAEAQMHLCVTEVGRKVAEFLPNQREERVRKFALNFVHPDNKERLSAADRERLGSSSRTTFLASLAVRNVRFPAEQIKSWFLWGWVCEALQKILQRGEAGGAEAPIDELDRLLGYSDGEIGSQGLLADFGLSAARLAERAAERVGDARGLPGPFRTNSSPDRLAGVGEFLAQAVLLLAELKEPVAAPRTAGSREGAPPAARAAAAELERWTAGWTEGLAAGGGIAGRLWQLAWDPASGRGLRWLDGLLVHAARVLDELARTGRTRPDLAELDERLAEARRKFQEFEKVRQKEEGSPLFRLRALAARLYAEGKRPYREAIVKKAASLARLLNGLREDLLTLQGEQSAARFVPRVWQEAARLLRRWRDDVLLPSITAADGALTLAANRRELAHEALRWHDGTNRRGPWRALSTVQVADDEMLDAFARRLAGGERVRVEELVLRPIQGPGISRERRRLTLESWRETARDELVEILSGHLAAATRGVLAFLDDGWMIPEATERLHTAGAKVLDLGAEPLVAFSRPAVGLETQSYLLVPRDLILPEPFGRMVGQGNRLTARDPLQLGVVSFIYGIPPNALEGMRELFLQYTFHLGDQAWHQAHDRYPLHVFRHAAEGFDEPHSPLALEMGEEFLREALQAARELGILNGRRRTRLDIRSFDGTLAELLRDSNRAIELVEKILHRLGAWPNEAEQLFAKGRFPGLERLFDGGRYGASAAWGAEGEVAGSVN